MTQEWTPTNKYKSGTKKDPMSKYVKLAEVAYAEGCKDTATKLLQHTINACISYGEKKTHIYNLLESMLKQLEEQK